MIIQHVLLCCSRLNSLKRTRPYGTFFKRTRLFFLLLSFLCTTTLSSASLLPPDTARAATTERRGEGEVNVLLGVQTDHVGRHVDDLLADTIPQSGTIYP